MVYAKRRPRAQQVGYCKTGKEKERKRNENPSKGLALKVQTVPIHPMVGFVVAGSLPKNLNLGLLKLVYNLGGGEGCSLEVNMHNFMETYTFISREYSHELFSILVPKFDVTISVRLGFHWSLFYGLVLSMILKMSHTRKKQNKTKKQMYIIGWCRKREGCTCNNGYLPRLTSVSVTIFRTICHSKMSTKRACVVL